MYSIRVFSLIFGGLVAFEATFFIFTASLSLPSFSFHSLKVIGGASLVRLALPVRFELFHLRLFLF